MSSNSLHLHLQSAANTTASGSDAPTSPKVGAAAPQLHKKEPEVQHRKLHFLCFTLGMFFLQVGWVITGNN